MMTPDQAQNLRLRVVSALVLTPCVLGAVCLGGGIFCALVMAAAVLGLLEWLRMVRPLSTFGLRWGAAFLAILVVGSALALPLGTLAALVLGAALAVGALAVYGAEAPAVFAPRFAWSALGFLYVGGGAAALVALREVQPHGLPLIVYLCAVVWGTDIGAFVAGRTIGGPKIWPAVSPNKTWAGLIGGMATAAVAGGLVVLSFGSAHGALAAGGALFLAVVAQAGDFFESAIKRRAGVKDSGSLIPGHGGILDRVDGLLTAALMLALGVGLAGFLGL